MDSIPCIHPYHVLAVFLPYVVPTDAFLCQSTHLRVRVGDVRPFGVLSRKEVFEMLPHMLLGVNLDFQAEQGFTLSQLTDDIHHATKGNVSLMRQFLTQIVIVLQEKKTAVVTESIVQRAYAKLRMQ